MTWIERFAGRKGAKRSEQDVRAPTLRTKTLAEQMLNPGIPSIIELPKFKSTAADKFDQQRRGAFDEMRARLYMVFSASQPVIDRRYFAGRSEVLQKLIRATEDLRLHTVLYGERGLGKTSLLLMLAQSAREARYLVVYISCGAKSAFDEVVRSIAAQIPLLYCKDIDLTSPDVESGKSFADLLPPGEISPQAASDVLAGIVGTRVLVVLDEFDRCQSKEFRLSIAELLKSLSDRSVRLQLLIAGVAGNLTELVEHIPSIQRNIFAHHLHRMSSAELKDIIRNGEVSTGLHFEPTAEDGLIQVANGFPYFACLLCCYAGLAALDDGRSRVTVDDVLQAIREAIEQFSGRISQLSKNQIMSFETSGHLENLGRLAGAAQAAGGHFEMGEVRALFPGVEGHSQSKDLVADLITKKIVIASFDDSDSEVLRFEDETIIPYIWLLSAHKRLTPVSASADYRDTPNT